MAYSFITFAQAKTALAQRLNDPAMQFWSDAELGTYIVESLRTFNALANFYRQEFLFSAQANITWYDLTDIVNLPSTLRPLTQTDADLLSAMLYHLLEPQSGGYPLVWAGSLQFNYSDLLNAIQQTRDEIMSETGCTITESLVPALPGRIFLADDTIDIRRVAWIPVTGQGYSLNVLNPSDLWADQAFDSGFPQNAPSVPLKYRRSTEPPLGFDVDPQPAVPGSYDVLTVDAGATLSSMASTVLPIPDDWCWVAKWGALAQLFGRDGVAADGFRAQYCATRYKQGLAAMTSAPALIGARINNVPVFVEPITNGDSYNANWQGAAPGAPSALYYAGLNVVALSPAPSTAGYSVTANVVRNMVVPTVNGDFIQAGRDDIGAILDESQHIAMLKCGGAEFIQTLPLHLNLLRRCALYNSKLAAESLYLEFLDGRGQDDLRLHPTFQGASPAGTKA